MPHLQILNEYICPLVYGGCGAYYLISYSLLKCTKCNRKEPLFLSTPAAYRCKRCFKIFKTPWVVDCCNKELCK